MANKKNKNTSLKKRLSPKNKSLPLAKIVTQKYSKTNKLLFDDFSQKQKHLISFSVFKMLVLFSILVFGFCLIYSSQVKKELFAKVENRRFLLDSMVLGRIVEISIGADLQQLQVLERLERLTYQRVNGLPSAAGQYFVDETNLLIYSRATRTINGALQPERLFELSISDNKVTQILDGKYKSHLTSIVLESELLSFYDDQHTVRASKAVPLKDFPPHLINAILAVEDERFYQHFGVDPIAIGRASFVNLAEGEIKQGASTITQQLIKALFYSNQKSFSRKLAEAFNAILLEMSLSKDEILELYLNEIFLGQEGFTAIYGFAEASLAFFDKDVQKISISEAAILAGVIKAPSSYSPRRYPKSAEKRRNIALAKMKELKFIDEVQYNAALKEELKVSTQQRYVRQAPYFLDFLRKDIESRFATLKPELRSIKIYTGLDTAYQKCAQEAITNGLQKLEKQYPRLKKLSSLQAILLGVSVQDRQIRSYVGGRDYSKNQFERISMAKRQPGSTFKPFVYLTALDGELNDYKPAKTTNILLDEPISIKVPGGYWEPKNFDNNFRGEVTFRTALARSLNIPTVELGRKIGIEAILKTAALFNFGNDLPAVPSIVLGAGDVSPLELTQAYLALANYGKIDDILAYTLIADDNASLFTAKANPQQVANPAAVFVLIDILRSVIEQGTGHIIRTLGFNLPAAGKTGTSNDSRDAWFVGFTPTHLATVWVGLDNNKQLGLAGGQAAAPIWAEYMKCISHMEPGADFDIPEGVIFRVIDLDTGLLWSKNCGSNYGIQEIFVSGTEPTIYCDDEKYLRTLRQSRQHKSETDYHSPTPNRPAQTPPPNLEREKSWWDKLWN
ncbi:MAG: PBP1A family penicillin-binding protein [Deltaproteobacteria bacterium]|jgi:penicillin-binding protein 1B|nr:PBP1A family penicillin-binding protein [Deltaproteobacteria bacterium]